MPNYLDIFSIESVVVQSSAVEPVDIKLNLTSGAEYALVPVWHRSLLVNGSGKGTDIEMDQKIKISSRISLIKAGPDLHQIYDVALAQPFPINLNAVAVLRCQYTFGALKITHT